MQRIYRIFGKGIILLKIGLIVELTLGAVVTPDHMVLPHALRPFETVQTLEGGAVTALRLRGHLDERGIVRLVPGSSTCPSCTENDIDLDSYDDLFIPFDVPFLWRLITEYPRAV